MRIIGNGRIKVPLIVDDIKQIFYCGCDKKFVQLIELNQKIAEKTIIENM